MTLAQRLFLAYGLLSITFGMLLGMPMSSIRMRAPEAPRHLVIAHLSAIIQGVMHLALAAVIALSGLPDWVETGSALLLIAGCALFVAGATLNWAQNIGDHFAARSLGWKLLAASGPLNVIAAVALLVGVVGPWTR